MMLIADTNVVIAALAGPADSHSATVEQLPCMYLRRNVKSGWS